MHWLLQNGRGVGVYGFIYLQTLAKGHGRIMARATGVTCGPSKKKIKKSVPNTPCREQTHSPPTPHPPECFLMLCCDESVSFASWKGSGSEWSLQLKKQTKAYNSGNSGMPRPAGSGWIQCGYSRVSAGPVYLFRALAVVSCFVEGYWHSMQRFVTSTTANEGLPAQWRGLVHSNY